jgi:hypothetical protein
MRIFRRLFLIFVGALALLYGYENVRINDAPETFTIEQIEREGVGGARYVVVTGAQATGRYGLVKLYSTSEPEKKYTTGAVVPLYSRQRLAESGGPELPATSLVYKLETVRGCVRDNNCGDAGPFDVRGVVKSGTLWPFDSDDFSDHYPRAGNFVYVADEVPTPKPLCLFFLLLGVALLALGLMPDRQFDKHVMSFRLR